MIICAHLWNALVGLAFQQIPTGNFHWYNSPDGERVGLPEAWKLALSVAFGVSIPYIMVDVIVNMYSIGVYDF